MGKPKLAGSSIQKGWFHTFPKNSIHFSRVITKDLSFYEGISLCIRQLSGISKSRGDFFQISDIELNRQDHVEGDFNLDKVYEPRHVKPTKIGQIVLGLINSSVYESAEMFSFYELHPTVKLFLSKFPRGFLVDQLGSKNGKYFFLDHRQYKGFDEQCKKLREELISSKNKLECRNFERNSQESKQKLKKAIGKLLRKKKRAYVLRLDLDTLQSPSPGNLFELRPRFPRGSLFNIRNRTPFEILSADMKEKWETLCRWLRRSSGTPELLGHASRLHCFPSVGFRLHVILIFDWMPYTEGRRLRDSIVRHWENDVTNSRGIAHSAASSMLVSSFPGCGAIFAKGGSGLDELYEQAIPYLTDMDLYMGRIIKHRTFNMWHSK